MDQNNQQKELDYLIVIGGQLDVQIQRSQIQLIQKPEFIILQQILPIGYNKTQFTGCLVKLIIEATKDQEKMKILKECSEWYKFSFKQQFQRYRDQFEIKSVNFGKAQRIKEIDCKISIFESMFLKIIQSENPIGYMEILHSIFIEYIKFGHEIQEQDFQLIVRIVNSNKVKPLIKELNTIRFKNNDQSDDHLNDEINQLLKVLSEPFFITETEHYGLTCLDGKIIFQSQIVNYKNQGLETNKYRALLIITCIHEVFFHLKRIKFCDMNDVLKSTPQKYSAAQSGKQPTVGEAGNYFEYSVFRNIIGKGNCSQELAEAILDPTKWEDDNFKFWNIQIKDSPNSQQFYESPQLKQGFQDIRQPSIQITKFCPSSLYPGERKPMQTKFTLRETT